MWSKNKKSATSQEKLHVEAVKSLSCVVCNAPPPSECHELKQGSWFVSAALCADCHRGSINGIHGQKRMWAVFKMDELDAVNETNRRLYI